MTQRILFFSIMIFSLIASAQSEKKAIKNGNKIFGTDTIHDIRISFNQCSPIDSLTLYKPSGKYMQANVSIDGKNLYAVGCRYKGESSYDFTTGKKKSFKIKFNEFVKGQDFDGLNTINLNNGFRDPSFLREKIVNDCMIAQGIPAPRTTYANVYFNGEFLGFYVLVEQIDKKFYQRNFGNSDGDAYKGEPQAYFIFLGDDYTLYENKYLKETNIKDNKWDDLIKLIKAINDTTISDELHKANLDKLLNTTGVIKAFAINNFFVNIDSYNITFRHNFYLYLNTTTGKFEWIPYDSNYGFLAFSTSLSQLAGINLSVFFLDESQGAKPLLRRIFKNKLYRAEYLTYYKSLLKTNFTKEYFNNLIDALAIKIRPNVYTDKNKFYTNDDFENSLEKTTGDVLDPGAFSPGLKSFIASRIQFLNSELKSTK